MIKLDSLETVIFAGVILGLLVTLGAGRPAGSQTAYIAVLGMVILVLVCSGYLLVVRAR